MQFVSKQFSELTTAELYEILRVRSAVFIVEQQCIYQDIDGRDPASLHVFYEEDGTILAYLRAFRLTDDTVQMGRVLTLHHGKGLGGKLLKAGIEEIRKTMHPRRIFIEAQSYATDFYAREGFQVSSEEFLEDGIPHVQMILDMQVKRLNIRKSTLQDVPRMMEIYAHARAFMAEHGNPRQWGPTHWPPEDLIVQDIQNGNSYVCTNQQDAVVGTFFFICGEDIEPTYRNITEGKWMDDTAYGVVHRIASDGSEKGIGSFCVNWAYEQCHHLRIDTHGDNTVMQGMLRKLGFVHCGTIYVEEDNDPRLAFEKSGTVHL